MLPGLAISAISLIVIFYFIDFGRLLEAMQHANFAVLALGSFGTLGWLAVRALACRSLLSDQPRYRDVFFAVNEGYLLNNLLPFRLGEVGRAFLLGRKPLPPSVEPVETEPVETRFRQSQPANTGFDKLNQRVPSVEPVETRFRQAQPADTGFDKLNQRVPSVEPVETGFRQAQPADTGFDKLNQRVPSVELVETKPVETGFRQAQPTPAGSDTVQPVAVLGFWRTLSSIVVERVFDLAFGVTTLLIALPFVINVPWAHAASQTVGLVVAVGLLILFLMGRNPHVVMGIFERLTARWTFANRLGGRILPRLLEGLSVFKDWKLFVSVVIWMALNWLIGLVIYMMYLRAFIPDAPLLWANFALGVAAIGGTIPSSPGNVGVLEGAIIGALTIFGVDPSIAFAYAITLHLVQVLFTTVLGIYGLSREGETLLGVYQQLRKRTL
jgi:uncharacterized membrane protein YbhN (UPF0104 family)